MPKTIIAQSQELVAGLVKAGHLPKASTGDLSVSIALLQLTRNIVREVEAAIKVLSEQSAAEPAPGNGDEADGGCCDEPAPGAQAGELVAAARAAPDTTF